MSDLPQRHEDDLAQIKISDPARKNLTRVCKKLRCHEHVIMDLVAMLLASSMEHKHVTKKQGRTNVRTGDGAYSYSTHISQDSLRILRPYLATLGISIADAMTDALCHVSSTKSIGFLQPLNCRNMSHFRRPLFRIEQGQPPTQIKEVTVDKAPKAAVA